MSERADWRNRAAWVLAGLLAALFGIAAGPPKVFGNPQAVEGFRALGYSDGFRIFIGLCETAGAIGLLVPRLATWAAAGLLVLMIGAVYTTMTHGETPVPALVAGVLLAVVAWLRRTRALGLDPDRE